MSLGPIIFFILIFKRHRWNKHRYNHYWPKRNLSHVKSNVRYLMSKLFRSFWHILLFWFIERNYYNLGKAINIVSSLFISSNFCLDCWNSAETAEDQASRVSQQRQFQQFQIWLMEARALYAPQVFTFFEVELLYDSVCHNVPMSLNNVTMYLLL